MNTLITAEDAIIVLKSFMDINEGDEATIKLLVSFAAELLDITEAECLDIVNNGW